MERLGIRCVVGREQPAFALVQVSSEFALGILEPSLADEVVNQSVPTQIGGMELLLVAPALEDQPHLGQGALDGIVHPGALRECDHGSVEREVRGTNPDPVTSPDRGVALGDRDFKLGEVLISDLRNESQGRELEGATDPEQVGPVLRAERADEDAAVDPVFHQAFVSQQPECLAQRVAGDPERGPKSLFGQPGPGRQATAGDLIAEDLGSLLSHGPAPDPPAHPAQLLGVEGFTGI